MPALMNTPSHGGPALWGAPAPNPSGAAADGDTPDCASADGAATHANSRLATIGAALMGCSVSSRHRRRQRQ
ncbi:MAG: hypothetical protein Tsb0020_33620 [Haliangiales bacterium]